MSEDTPESDKAAAWRRRLGLGGSALESSAEAAAPVDRVALAREHMRKIVFDRHGGDPALLAQVKSLAISGEEAVALLQDEGPAPAPEQFSALEAIVAFDGTRPSFLVRNDRIDFDSSFAVDPWRVQLDPHLDDLRHFASCVGRVEGGEAHVGTAFLIAPTLALTNRHVAQSIADVGVDPPDLLNPAFLDFGREDGSGRASHDRRAVKRVLLVGADEIISGPVVHSRLDLALLEVAPSALPGAEGVRFLPLSSRAGALPGGWLVGAVGYPSDWHTYVPERLQTEYDAVLKRLLDGDTGTKRFAPGRTTGMVDGAPGWSATHDATTINGNSGSPMAHIRSGALKVTGLHYGGRWGGERTNWVHVLGNCGDGACFPGGVTLRDALARHGVTL